MLTRVLWFSYLTLAFVSVAQVPPNQTIDVGNVTGSVTLPTGAATEITQQAVLATIAGFAPGGIGTVNIQDGAGNPLTSQVNGAQRALDIGINVGGIQVDPRDRNWALSSPGDSISAVQSGTWDIGNITGTISLPTGAATESTLSSVNTSIQSNQPRNMFDGSGTALTSQTSGSKQPLDVGIVVSGAQIDPRDRNWNLGSGSDSVASVQSGAWTTGRTWNLSSGSDSVAATQSGTWTVQQGTPPWAVSQSGAWTTGRTWALSSGTDSVAASQSGTWTVQQGSAPWSVSQSGSWTTGRTWTLNSGTDSVTTTTTITGTASTNVAQFGGNNVVTGTGISGSGIPRVTVSSDSSMGRTWTLAQTTDAIFSWLKDGVGNLLTSTTAGSKQALDTNMAAIDSGVIYNFSSKLKIEPQLTPISITSNVTYTTIYTYSGSGYLIGFGLEFGANRAVVKVVIDGNTVMDGNDISALNALNSLLNNSARYQSGSGLVTQPQTLDFSFRFPIKFTSSVTISARLSGGAALNFTQGIVYIEKD